LNKSKQRIFISYISNNNKSNSIPRDITIYGFISKFDIFSTKKLIEQFIQTIIQEFSKIDDGIKIDFEITKPINFWKNDFKEEDNLFEEYLVFEEEFTERLISFLFSVFDGVFSWSGKIKGLVESSSNISLIEYSNNFIIFYFCVIFIFILFYFLIF
jgi:hypothetical protein